MTGAPDAAAPHPAVRAVARRRGRAIAGLVMWMTCLVVVALVSVLMLLAVRSIAVADALGRLGLGVLESGVLPRWVAELSASGVMLMPLLALLVVAVVIAVAAAIVAPVSIVRRILAPIVIAGAAAVTWIGLGQMMRGLQRFTPDDVAVGALVLAGALAIAVLGTWIGMGSRAAGLGAVPLAAFLGMLLPLVALGAIAIAPDSSLTRPGAAQTVFALHWLQVVAVVVVTALSGVLLARTATYRR